MKKHLYRFLSCALLVLAALGAYAENGIKETRNYTICPGDTMKLSTRDVVVTAPTILYDTLIVATIEEDSIIAYVVNLYPRFEKDEYRRLQKGESYEWQGLTITDPGVYVSIHHTVEGDGCDSIYRLHVTQPIDSALTFTLCEGQSITFNGRTYSNAGVYEDILSGDTVYTITIVKNPSREYVQYGVLDRTHPYYWQYMLNGEAKTDTLWDPGRYVYTTPNPETGCNDTWILVLTRDETQFHSIETVTICENEEFDWRGHKGLNRLGVGQTIHYYDRYRTVADQDSIYELILTVNPVLRSVRTIPFCGSIEWNGKTYTESETLVDSLTSVQFNCDSIVTTILKKGTPVVHKDTISILGGESLNWHGQMITIAGDYTDIRHSSYGCDTTFMLHVTLTEPAHTMNTHSEWVSICQGDGLDWHDKTYYNSGIYYDTIKAGDEIDSLYILYLRVNPKYELTERVTFLSFPTTYREQTIPQPGKYVFQYQSSLGCDSIITSYIDQEVYEDVKTVTICPGQTYIWDYDGETYTVGGKYTKTEKTADGLTDSVRHVLNLKVNYIPETSIEHTMCKGAQYTFAGETLTESGVYRHTYHKEGGCDSVVVLSLNVLNPDTTYLAIQRNEGDSYVWEGETIRDPGIYFHYYTNRFGCDSVSMLQFTFNQIDTIEAALTVCPNELPYEWNGISANQTKVYTKLVQEPSGSYTYYVLDLTVREVAQKDTAFVICEGSSVTYNGVTYDEAGHYRTYISCDTLMNVHISVNLPAVYETHGTVTAEHGFTWTYRSAGQEYTAEFPAAGTYEFEDPNPETGCNDIYRLILTQDDTEYHFEESLTICEGDDFSWRGLSNLSSVTGTNTYTDAYKTRNGKDSIYTLHLTVTPVERTVRTITFCDETTWNGKTYANSAVVYDTIALSNGCYRIERINLDKTNSFYSKEYKDLPQGTVLHWHEQNITTDGVYYDYGMTVHGCDSTYEIEVTIIPAAPQSNQYAEELSACEGDTIIWRGMEIFRSGVYVDTVPGPGTDQVDSIFTLTFTAWPAPKDTIIQHLYTCSDGAAIRYQGKDYYQDQTVVEHLHTMHGCDSIVKVYMHFNTATYRERTDTIVDTELPYSWTYQLYDEQRHDTVLTKSGTYTHRISSEGGCTSQETLTLVVLKTYLFELDTTICETKMPLLWRGQYLQHTVGQTKQYEDVLKTVNNNTDSIYRINLTIDPAPKRVERIEICENKDTIINKKSYFDPIKYPVGLVFRDTVYKENPGNECDSIIYLEITKIPQNHIIEQRILHVDESFVWHNQTISEPITKTYTIEDEIDPTTGCENIYQINVIAEDRTSVVICDSELPYTWLHNHQDYNTSGVFTDTIFSTDGKISEFYSLYLTVTHPYDTTVYIQGCSTFGATWRDKTYMQDTEFTEYIPVDPYDPYAPCDSIFHVSIKINKDYYIERFDTICEHRLPYVIGQGDNQRTFYQEGYLPTQYFKTACGCDSIVDIHLTIIPDFDIDGSDSIFVCEENMPVYIGDTVHPAFDPDRQKVNEWKDKWIGVKISNDTVIYNCGKVDSLHIIMRPHQAHIPEVEYTICRGDSAQPFWPHNPIWIKNDTVVYDTIPNINPFEDTRHASFIHSDRAYVCDSITKWTFHLTDTLHKHLYKDIRDGETYIFNDSILATTGVYDSIGDYTTMDSAHHYCKAYYHLHLTVHPVYRMTDTLELCERAYQEVAYGVTTADDSTYIFKFTTPDQDTAILVMEDSLMHPSYQHYDHYYKLVVRYHQEYLTHVYDTICEGTERRFDLHHRDNTQTQRFFSKKGTYTDTIPATNGCDSIIVLHLETRDSIPTTYLSQIVTDRQLPFVWENDSLWVTGAYRHLWTGANGCDSAVVMNFTVHETHVFRDTIDVCDAINKTLTHVWSTGHKQEYTTPLADDTVHYYDTLITFYPLDSIYDLFVNFHRTYETHLYDTICNNSYRYWYEHHRDGTRTTHSLHYTGTYYDTIPGTNLCDSVLILHLFVRDPVPTKTFNATITDRELPYLWSNTWEKADRTDTTHVDTLWVSGSYKYIMPNQYGCDSIVTMNFTVHETHVFRDTIEVCDAINKTLTHVWSTGHKQEYTTPLVDDTVHYYDTLITFYPLDSIYDLFVNFHRTYETHIYDTICAGDSVQIRTYLPTTLPKQYYKETGIYSETIPTVHGCDSVITLHLQVWPGFPPTHKRVDIADIDTPYIWTHTWWENGQLQTKNDSLYHAGPQSVTLPNIHGCDSIDSLTLYIHQTYQIWDDTINICEHDVPYKWRGLNNISTTDDYIYGEQTVDGYDSIHYVHINVWKQTYDTVYLTICEGDSVRWGMDKKTLAPRFVHTAGLHNDTTINQYGCDHVKVLNLTVHPKYYHEWTVDIADIDTPYVWKHFNYAGDSIGVDSLYATGKYGFRFKSALACDSIDSLNLVVHNTYLFTEEFTICERQTPYSWQNQPAITQSGTYYYNPRTKDGYDSIYIATITVMPTVREIITEEICKNNLPFIFHGKNLTQGGIYIDTLASTASGCDSIVELHLTVNDPYYHYERHDIYEGETYHFFDQNCTTGGTYTHSATTPAGCDSITEILLVVHPQTDTIATVCSTDLPFVWVNHWNGKQTLLYSAGLYHDDTTYVDGERTFWSIQLNVTEPTDTTLYREICEGDHYTFNGQDLTQAGEYRDTIRRVNGCDSVIILHLNVLRKYYNIIEKSIYQGDSVLFQGTWYKEAGTYPYTIPSSYGCDSVIELRLTVNRLYDDSVSVCANNLPYYWYLPSDPTKYMTINESGIYRDTVVSTEGRETPIGLKVTVLPIAHAPAPINVTICEGDFYKFGESMLSEQGTYYDTLVAANGCDSVVMLALQVQPLNYQSEVRRIYEGDSVLFNGTWYKESGVYEHRELNANGCMDTYQLILTVLKEFRVDTTAYVCANDLPFVWRGIEYSESGDYSMPIAWTDSSRVVKTLHLTVREAFYSEEHISICYGNIFVINNKVVTDSTDYFDTIPARNGCDSIIRYIISVYPKYEKWDTVHISDKQTYNFDGRDLSVPGDYERTTLTNNGCDSIVHLHLEVHPSYYFKDSVDICQPDSYSWANHGNKVGPVDPITGLHDDQDMIITESGVYYDRKLTHYGFDSIYELKVTVHPSYEFYEQYEIGEGEQLTLHGMDITTPGTYTDHLLSMYGCDSIYKIVVNPRRTREFTWNKTICQGDYIAFPDGSKKTETGNYTYYSENRDTVIYLSLTVIPVNYTEERIVIPSKYLSEAYLHTNGKLYQPTSLGANVFEEKVASGNKCDNVHRLILYVTNKVSDVDEVPLCEGETITVNGKVITQPGLYPLEVRSKSSLETDSLHYVEVYLSNKYDFPMTFATICDDDSIVYSDSYGTKVYKVTGLYEVKLKTVDGCDSIHHLNLTVNPTFYKEESIRVLDDELPYNWEGEDFTMSGDYTHRTLVNECDDTHILHLEIVETQYVEAYDTICNTDTLYWRGKAYYQSGDYYDTYRDAVNKHKTVYTLHLQVVNPTTIVSARAESICADAESFDIVFNYSGHRPATYSIYFDVAAKQEGFADLINQPLTEPKVAHVPMPVITTLAYENHPYYIKPNTYKLRLVLDNGVCGLSKSEDLQLEIKYPSWIIEQCWNDVVVPLKQAYNGGYEFSQVDWIVNGVRQQNNGKGYLQHTFSDGDEVVMMATRKGENYAIETCPLTIGIKPNLTYDDPILVYPTQAPRARALVKVKAPRGGEYELYNSTGLIISSGQLISGENELTLPATSGIYFIRTKQGDEVTSHKVLIY